MKERLSKIKSSEEHVDKCCVCGLRSDTVNSLSKFDIENIFIPTIDVQVPLLKEECFCDDCKNAIKDEIWNRVLLHKPKKNVMGLFFDLKKYVQKFVADNKDEFEDIARDYEYLLMICKKIDDCLSECTDNSQSKIEELRDVPIPTVSSIRKLCGQLNNTSSELSRYFKDAGIPGKVSGTLADTTNLSGYDFRSLLGDNALSNALEQIPNPALMLLSVKAELGYETPVVRFKIFAYDDVKSKKIMKSSKKQTEQEDDKPTGGFTI